MKGVVFITAPVLAWCLVGLVVWSLWLSTGPL